MLKSLLRVRFAALLAAFTGQSRKRGRQTKGKAVGYALLAGRIEISLFVAVFSIG